MTEMGRNRQAYRIVFERFFILPTRENRPARPCCSIDCTTKCYGRSDARQEYCATPVMPEARTSKRTGNVCHLKPSRTDRQTSPGRKEPFSCWSRPVYQGAFDEKLETQSPKGMLWSSNIDQRTLTIWMTSETSSFMCQASPSDCQGTFQWYMYMKVCGPYPWF